MRNLKTLLNWIMSHNIQECFNLFDGILEVESDEKDKTAGKIMSTLNEHGIFSPGKKKKKLDFALQRTIACTIVKYICSDCKQCHIQPNAQIPSQPQPGMPKAINK